MTITPIQHAVILGTLLGDGAMRCKANALLEVNHCAAQMAYVDWKFDILRDLVRTPPKLRTGNGERRAYRFTTRSLPDLNPYYRLFYAGARKSVPTVDLDPLALAVWFMDDGSKSRRSVYLNTQQFDMQSQLRLAGMLLEQFGLLATLNRDKIYVRLRIAGASMPRLRDLIGPYVLPEMRYKVPC